MGNILTYGDWNSGLLDLSQHLESSFRMGEFEGACSSGKYRKMRLDGHRSFLHFVQGQSGGALTGFVPIVNYTVDNTTTLYADLNDENTEVGDLTVAKAIHTGDYTGNHVAFVYVVLMGGYDPRSWAAQLYAVDTTKVNIGNVDNILQNWNTSDKGWSYQIPLNPTTDDVDYSDYNRRTVVFCDGYTAKCTVYSGGSAQFLYYPFLFIGHQRTAAVGPTGMYFPIGLRNTSYDGGFEPIGVRYIDGGTGDDHAVVRGLDNHPSSRTTVRYFWKQNIGLGETVQVDAGDMNAYAQYTFILALEEEFKSLYVAKGQLDTSMATKIRSKVSSTHEAITDLISAETSDIASEVEVAITNKLPSLVKETVDGKFISI